MTEERWSQIEGLFLQAVEIPPNERDDFLSKACKGDDILRREVNSLLACDAPDIPLIQGPFLLVNGVRNEVLPAPDMAGRRIGSYRLVRLLGHGGMGSVHLAVRDDDHYRK